MTPDDPTGAIRARLLRDHEDPIADTIDAADAVAGTWHGEWTDDRDRVAPLLTAELRSRGVVDRYPALIETAASAGGYDLPAVPVSAPPHVTVASTGPLLRATVSEGRLVIELNVFDVTRDPVRYRRTGHEPGAVLDVAFLDDG